MKIISHRGNIEGPGSSVENHPDQIKKVLEMGFDVEIDVWFLNSKWFLGHDGPENEIDIQFLFKSSLWCHAKNIESMFEMSKYSCIHSFWHQNDDVTLTSRGYMWTYPGKPLTKSSICVMPETVSTYTSFDCYGICTDLPVFYKEMLM